MTTDQNLAEARAAYERALAAYEEARGATDRVSEYATAREVDRARRIYFTARDARGLHPESLRPAGAEVVHRRWRKLRPGWRRLGMLVVLERSEGPCWCEQDASLRSARQRGGG